MTENKYFSESIRIWIRRASRVTIQVVALFIVLLSFKYGIGQEIHILPQAQYPQDKTNFTNHPGESKFKVRADLVLVPVTVTDEIGRLVTGLDAEDFHVFEG